MSSPETLVSVAPSLWAAPRSLKLGVGDIGTRMTVIRLADGSLFLHSPVKLDDATRAALDALGPVRHVVAPSKVHHFFAGDYTAAYRDAVLYAPPGLQQKRKDLHVDVELSDEPQAAWRGQIDQHLFRGAPMMNEVVFLHRPTRTLVLTDLAFNVSADEGTFLARLFYRIVGAAGRFGPHRLLRLGIRDKAAARTSVQTILGWDFDRVTVTHGAILETGGKEALRRGFEFLG